MAYGWTALYNRLIALRSKWAPAYRPDDKAFGRFLGDFLDQKTPTGLLNSEFQLLFACINGAHCELLVNQQNFLHWPTDKTESDRQFRQKTEWALAITGNQIRAEFLRFLILRGDEFAPVHEAGIQLSNAVITSKTAAPRMLLDLRGGDCIGRVCLVNSILEGRLQVEDAKLGILMMEGSWLAGISADRAKISGSVLLNDSHVSNELLFNRAEIGGSLQCSRAAFGWADRAPSDPARTMLDLSGAKIAGSVSLNQNFVSEGGISFFGTHIGGNLDCVGAAIDGALKGDRATIGGNLKCRNASLAGGLSCIGAVIAGDADLSWASAKRTVSLAGANIGGSVFCTGATLKKDTKTHNVIANVTLFLSKANIKKDAKTDNEIAMVMLDLSQTKIKGDVRLEGPMGNPFLSEGAVWFRFAQIGGDLSFSNAFVKIGRTPEAKTASIDGQNVKVDGSIFFGIGFETFGQVWLFGAEIGKDLDFSGSVFHNSPGVAIVADRCKIGGSLRFQSVGGGQNRRPFRAFGGVSLTAAQCADMHCEGGEFISPGGIALDGISMNVAGSVALDMLGGTPFQSIGMVRFESARIGQHLTCYGGRLENPRVALDPTAFALNCGSINVSGSVFLCNVGKTPFSARGMVNFNTCVIGQHLNLQGAKLQNPSGVAMDCQGSTIKGCVFLGDANTYASDRGRIDEWAFWSDGVVTFNCANVGMEFHCQNGYFRNYKEDSAVSGQAAIALDLAVAKIGGTLFLGREGSQPPTMEGSVDLTGATVSVLVDGGFTNDDLRGLRGTVAGKDANGVSKPLQCIIKLDQFSYDRLKGDHACESDMRKAWLKRQPLQDMQSEFKPQPFEQLVTVMRAMGYDDEADDIALFKRQTKRKMKPLIDIPEVDWRFPTQAAGVVGAAWLAILGDKAAWLAILGDKLVLGYVVLLVLFRKVLAKLGEVLLLDWFVGYGYNMARAVFLLLLLVLGFGNFYAWAFQKGAIVPSDKDVRHEALKATAKLFATTPTAHKGAATITAECSVWSVSICPGIADQAIPLFNPWLYSADMMVPIVTFGQKAAWAPTPNVGITLPVVGQLEAPSNFVYDVQLVETVLGWVEGFLLVSFVTGLIAKE